jgi:hypothetical protein
LRSGARRAQSETTTSNSFFLRADPIGPAPKLEPGMTVWIDEEGPIALAR